MIESGTINTMKNRPQTPLNILLADDDIDDCFFFDQASKEIEIETQLTTVHDGEQLMDYLYAHIENLPDAIFLDLSMPRKSGFECLTEIKENIKFNEIPIVVFSTSFSKDLNYELSLMNILYKIGMTDFIRKPRGFVQLKEIIAEALAKILRKTAA